MGSTDEERLVERATETGSNFWSGPKTGLRGICSLPSPLPGEFIFSRQRSLAVVGLPEE